MSAFLVSTVTLICLQIIGICAHFNYSHLQYHKLTELPQMAEFAGIAANSKLTNHHRTGFPLEDSVQCDVVILGGSAAALGAALAAAEASKTQTICLTEPTDWLGGQLTTSAVSAVDFGANNQNWWYQSKRFQAMMESVGVGNPGNCWVSVKCFLPRTLLDKWIIPSVTALKNLKVFYNTVPVFVETDGRIVKSVQAVQRHPRHPPYTWNRTFSEDIADWYSRQDSSVFVKTLLTFKGYNGDAPIVIDATEFGEVLVLANASYSVGVEAPMEDSKTTIEKCAQCTTIPFYMGANLNTVQQNIPNPGGSFSMQNFTWNKIWTYRRSLAMPNSTEDSFNLGETSNQNWGGGNDFCQSSIFLSHEESAKQRSSWIGGVNITALAMAEERAYGWFHFYKEKSDQNISKHLYLNKEVLETVTGLSKLPYLRDSRRSIGIFGFRLLKEDMDKPHYPKGYNLQNNLDDSYLSRSSTEVPSNPQKNYQTKNKPYFIDGRQPPSFATRFNDSICLGNYLYADVHGVEGCAWPAYINNETILPYHIPFRALTNADFDNLLVAGKVMAQTFQAQAATRMHPSDFMTGEAAGSAAVLMKELKLSTLQLYHNVSLLQDRIEEYMPIFWDKPRQK